MVVVVMVELLGGLDDGLEHMIVLRIVGGML
jgi:hypothetical protein